MLVFSLILGSTSMYKTPCSVNSFETNFQGIIAQNGNSISGLKQILSERISSCGTKISFAVLSSKSFVPLFHLILYSYLNVSKKWFCFHTISDIKQSSLKVK